MAIKQYKSKFIHAGATDTVFTKNTKKPKKKENAQYHERRIRSGYKMDANVIRKTNKTERITYYHNFIIRIHYSNTRQRNPANTKVQGRRQQNVFLTVQISV